MRSVNAEEPIENLLLIFGSNTYTRIAHAQIDLVDRARGANGDPAALGSVLDCVVDEYAKHLFDRDLVGKNCCVVILDQLERMRGRDQLEGIDHVADDLRQLEHLHLQRLTALIRARKEQQLLDQLLHVFGLRVDRFDALF